MTESQAKPLILAEMRRRLPAIPYRSPMGGFAQYMQLVKERPELFSFPSAAAKWQVVQGWLNEAGLVVS